MIHKTNMDKSQVLPSINNRKRKRGMSRGMLELKINNREENWLWLQQKPCEWYCW